MSPAGERGPRRGREPADEGAPDVGFRGTAQGDDDPGIEQEDEGGWVRWDRQGWDDDDPGELGRVSAG